MIGQSIASGNHRAEWADIMRIHIKPVGSVTIENNASSDLDTFDNERTSVEEESTFLSVSTGREESHVLNPIRTGPGRSAPMVGG